MFRFRAFFSVILALVAFVLVSCGGPKAVAPPPTYSETQLQQIQQYLPEIQGAYDRLDALNDAILEGNWQEIRSTIRGPFGSMLQDLNYVTLHLLPSDQTTARSLSRKLFQDFQAIDLAASEKNIDSAESSFNAAVRDLDQFLANLPEMPSAEEIVEEVMPTDVELDSAA